MTQEELNKIRACKALLPEPGPEVVDQLLDEIQRQHYVILDLKKRLAVCIAERKVVEKQMRMKGETTTT
jgi:hypothetical protein